MKCLDMNEFPIDQVDWEEMFGQQEIESSWSPPDELDMPTKQTGLDWLSILDDCGSPIIDSPPLVQDHSYADASRSFSLPLSFDDRPFPGHSPTLNPSFIGVDTQLLAFQRSVASSTSFSAPPPLTKSSSAAQFTPRSRRRSTRAFREPAELRSRTSSASHASPSAASSSPPSTKRRPHYAIERRYRANLNQKILSLGAAIPGMYLGGSGGNGGSGDRAGDAGGAVLHAGKINKSAVLSSAIEYIQYLERQCVEKDTLIEDLAAREKAVRLALEGDGQAPSQ